MVYVKNTKVKAITNVIKLKTMCGMKGFTGNKGAVSVRFEVYGKSMLFVNCHLESGQENNEGRIKNLK